MAIESGHTDGWPPDHCLAWLDFPSVPSTWYHLVARIGLLPSGNWGFRVQLKYTCWQQGCSKSGPSCVSLCWGREGRWSREVLCFFFLVISRMYRCSLWANNKLRTSYMSQANPLVIRIRCFKLLKSNEAYLPYRLISDYETWVSHMVLEILGQRGASPCPDTSLRTWSPLSSFCQVTSMY